MPVVERKALMPYSASQMFDLIGDIERYPEFMRDCVAAEIIERTPAINEAGDAKTIDAGSSSPPATVTAKLTIKKAGFSQSFTTKNTLHPPHKMSLELVDGPFKSLHGFWAFENISSNENPSKASPGCRVTFYLNYQFRSAMLGMLGGPVFERSAEEQVRNLSARARQIYG